MIGTPAGLQRRPMTAEGEKRPISAAGIRQDFEGHGIAVLPELERGYINGPLRPMSAARALPEGRDGGSSSATGAAASDGSRRRRKKQPAEARMRIHVHLREKTMEVNAGTGGQCIFWLGVTGVQRYVVDPDSYTRPYSEELTPKVRRSRLPSQLECSSLHSSLHSSLRCSPLLLQQPDLRLTLSLARCNPVHSRPRPCPCQGVLGEDGAWIETTARIRDELEDGDHVWIDVGDGNPHPYPVIYPNPTLALASTLTCGPTWATASRARPQPQCLQPSPPLSALGPAPAPASVAVTAEAVAEAEACFSPGKPLSVVSSRVFQNPKYMPKGEDPEVRSPSPPPPPSIPLTPLAPTHVLAHTYHHHHHFQPRLIRSLYSRRFVSYLSRPIFSLTRSPHHASLNHLTHFALSS